MNQYQTIQRNIPISKIILALLIALTVISPVYANQHSVGDVTIHYNALNTASIPAEVASKYNISRGARTGMVNITVMKNNQPVIANIFGHGRNLASQLKELAFKEIKEEDAIYYIATFTFNDQETVIFDLQIRPEKQGILIPLQFKQQMYTEKAR